MKYNVTVNGKKYEVEIERADASASADTAAKAAAQAAKVPVATPPAGAESAAPAGSAVLAPMPGSITDVRVKVGGQVKKGQPILILEAMKMENEILADHDGVVESIAVSRGMSVNTGDILLTLK